MIPPTSRNRQIMRRSRASRSLTLKLTTRLDTFTTSNADFYSLHLDMHALDGHQSLQCNCTNRTSSLAFEMSPCCGISISERSFSPCTVAIYNTGCSLDLSPAGGNLVIGTIGTWTDRRFLAAYPESGRPARGTSPLVGGSQIWRDGMQLRCDYSLYKARGYTILDNRARRGLGGVRWSSKSGDLLITIGKVLNVRREAAAKRKIERSDSAGYDIYEHYCVSREGSVAYQGAVLGSVSSVVEFASSIREDIHHECESEVALRIESTPKPRVIYTQAGVSVPRKMGIMLDMINTSTVTHAPEFYLALRIVHLIACVLAHWIEDQCRRERRGKLGRSGISYPVSYVSKQQPYSVKGHRTQVRCRILQSLGTIPTAQKSHQALDRCARSIERSRWVLKSASHPSSVAT